MKILLTGATGFIGRHLLESLLAAGYEVVCAGRKDVTVSRPGQSHVLIDYNRALRPDDWVAAVQGVDVVINAVGLLRELPGQSFDTLHRAAPCALFEAAADSGVKHIVQISALGADAEAASGYHMSKKAADDFLLSLNVRSTIVQPSLVYGPGGASAALFERFASMPLIPLPGSGTQQIQPVHIDDLVLAVLSIIRSKSLSYSHVAIVGPEPLSLRGFYSALRAAMRFARPARFVSVPLSIVRVAAMIGSRFSGGFLDGETLGMLQRGNTGDVRPVETLLGRRPRHPIKFIPRAYANAVAVQARLRWLLPMLRWSIALVWIITGLVSFGLYPVEQSYALLARTGVPTVMQPLFLYGAATLDLVLGGLAIWPRRRPVLWMVQGLLVLAYTLIITLKLPEFWLHPYGPIVKNIPFVAVLWLLYELEDRSWNT